MALRLDLKHSNQRCLHHLRPRNIGRSGNPGILGICREVARFELVQEMARASPGDLGGWFERSLFIWTEAEWYSLV